MHAHEGGEVDWFTYAFKFIICFSLWIPRESILSGRFVCSSVVE